MKARLKEALKAQGITPNKPNRRQGRCLPLCVCGRTKAEHYKDALHCNYKGSNTPNRSYNPA